MQSTRTLIEEHKEILRALDVLEEMVARAHRGQETDDKDVKDIVEFLKGFGGRHHQGKEEIVFFPALLRDRGQKHYQELCSLVFQHNRQRFLIDGIADSVVTNKKRNFVYYAAQLVKTLRTHLSEEDRVLFALAEATLSPDDDARAARDMKEYDLEWKERELAGLLHGLHTIESKYLRKRLTAAAS